MPRPSRVASRIRHRLLPVALVLCVGSLGLFSCGLGDKQAQAERIHGSLEPLPDVVSVTMTLDVTLGDNRVAGGLGGDTGGEAPNLDEMELPDGAELPDELPEGVPGAEDPAPPLTVVGNYRPDGRAASVKIGDDEKVSAIFVGDEIFVRRQNARPTERRRWARVDTSDDDVDLSRPLGLEDMPADRIARAVATSINPGQFVDLTIGVLTGSIEVVSGGGGSEENGAGEQAGDGSTDYEFKVSLDKMFTDLDLDDDTRGIREGMFGMFGITKDVVDGRATHDAEGRLRRIEIDLQVKVTRTTSHDLTVTVEVGDGNPKAFPKAPPEAKVVTYTSVGRLVSAAMVDGR